MNYHSNTYIKKEKTRRVYETKSYFRALLYWYAAKVLKLPVYWTSVEVDSFNRKCLYMVHFYYYD